MALNIVLVEPEIPQNTGNVVRTCAALGAVLHLVHPLGFSLSEKHLKRAGLDYWPLLTLVEHPDLTTFLETVANKELFFFTTKAPRSYTALHYPADAYLVFGKESKGLDEELLATKREQCVRIPMRGGIRSLNLSNSVAIAAYEWERQHTFNGLQERGTLQRLAYKE